METLIEISVSGQAAEMVSAPPYLVAGSANIYYAKFSFDESWTEYASELYGVFQSGKTEMEVLLEKATCAVPEAVLVPGNVLKIGVYGKNGDKTLPTIWCAAPTKTRPGANPVEAAAPENESWRDVLTKALATKADGLQLSGSQLQLLSGGIPIGNAVEIAVDGLPEVTEADNGKIPMVVDGVWVNTPFPAGTQYDPLEVTLPASSWTMEGEKPRSAADLGKSVDGLVIQVAPVPNAANIQEAAACGVYAADTDGNWLIFRCLNDTAPAVDLAFHVLVTKPTTLSYSTDGTTMTLNILEGG